MPSLPALLLILLAGIALTAGKAGAQDNPAVPTVLVANLQLPDAAWPARRDDIAAVLQQLQPDVVVIGQVQSTAGDGPSACWLATRLRMHCDFITADPPSHRLRVGVALLSPRPLLADGATLLHGPDDSPPVAAGYLRMDIDGAAVDLYVASLAPGEAQRPRRAHQAADLRAWMASHEGHDSLLVAGRFGATTAELQQLLPGLRAARHPEGTTAVLPHGLDVLYPPHTAQLLATGEVTLAAPAGPATEDSPDTAPAPAGLTLGIWARLALPGRP
jgi:endonuclease/exonuclease/phosphatase (EEP) superfamily protein YafD